MSPVCVLDGKYEPMVDGRLENIKRGIFEPPSVLIQFLWNPLKHWKNQSEVQDLFIWCARSRILSRPWACFQKKFLWLELPHVKDDVRQVSL